MKPCPDTFPFPLVALDETASTNQYLSQLCNQLQESVAELTTVTAEFQTAGKGQRGNTWEAEEGKNLLFSFVLYPSFLEARRQFILSQIVSLAIKEELSRWSDEITIKWPNDIYWKDKKICGILIENDLSGHHIRRSIAGIGININQEVFNSDAPNPVHFLLHPPARTVRLALHAATGQGTCRWHLHKGAIPGDGKGSGHTVWISRRSRRRSPPFGGCCSRFVHVLGYGQGFHNGRAPFR
jgi:biotin-(acetyl-CoA carboxylase) ligase